MDRLPVVLPRDTRPPRQSAGPRVRRLGSLTVAYVIAYGVVTGCAAEISPSEASPFQPVTISGGNACDSGDTAVARSRAFADSVTLTRSDGELQGRATVADVPPGSYDVEVVCEDGSTTRTSLEVRDLPGPADTGTAPGNDGGGGVQWAAGAVLAAGVLSLGIGVYRRGRVNSER